MRAVAFILVVLACTSAKAEVCDYLITQQVNECWESEFKKTEIRLNQKYKQVMASLSQKDEPYATTPFSTTRKALLDAQRAWVPFREKHCSAVNELYSKGTISTKMHFKCLINAAEIRIKELEEFQQ